MTAQALSRRTVFFCRLLAILQTLPQFDRGISNAAPGFVHSDDRAAEASALFLDLVNLFYAFGLEVKEAADFRLRFRRLFFQLGDLERQPLHVPILVGAVVAVLQSLKLFLLRRDVSVKLGELF